MQGATIMRSGPSMIPGIVTTVAGAALLAPLLYRYKTIDWNALFTYIFIGVGAFLLATGAIAILRAWYCSGQQQEAPIDSLPTIQPSKPPEVIVGNDYGTMELNTVQNGEDHKRSDFYKFAMGIGLLPSLPLALSILVSSTCSMFSFGLGFGCTHPGYGHTYWPEIFAITGILGWFLSLPAWGLLALAGKLLGVR